MFLNKFFYGINWISYELACQQKNDNPSRIRIRYCDAPNGTMKRDGSLCLVHHEY